MKQTQQAHEYGNMRIEHVFCPPDPMVPAEQRTEEIEGKEGLKYQQSRRLHREKKRTFEPKGDHHKQVAHVAEPKEILRTIVAPVDRHPHQHPNRPQCLEPEWNAHGVILS